MAIKFLKLLQEAEGLDLLSATPDNQKKNNDNVPKTKEELKDIEKMIDSFITSYKPQALKVSQGKDGKFLPNGTSDLALIVDNLITLNKNNDLSKNGKFNAMLMTVYGLENAKYFNTGKFENTNPNNGHPNINQRKFVNVVKAVLDTYLKADKLRENSEFKDAVLHLGNLLNSSMLAIVEKHITDMIAQLEKDPVTNKRKIARLSELAGSFSSKSMTRRDEIVNDRLTKRTQ